MRVGYELAIIISYPTSASGIIVLWKKGHKISRILPNFINCKNNRFSACFLFWADAYSYHIWRAWYNGSYTMMAKPIRALVLHYRMIQFLIIKVSKTGTLCTILKTENSFKALATCVWRRKLNSRFETTIFRVTPVLPSSWKKWAYSSHKGF